jgi:ABC-type transporter Mla subunit MlaD
MPLQDLTPQLRTRLNRMEKAVGWFVFLATVLLLFGFGYYLYHTAERKGWFKIKAHFKTYLQSSAGLKAGDNIYMMGFAIGNVTRIHAMPPGDAHNVLVEFEVTDPYFRYIRSHGSVVKINAGFLGQSQVEVSRGNNDSFALAVTQPVFRKTLDELKQIVLTESNQWQLSQYVFDVRSNAVFIPYQPYDGLDESNLNVLASLNLESNAVFAYNNTLNRNRVVAAWREDLHRYDFYDLEKDGPIELPAAESVPVAERLDRIIGQVETALPNILSLTNKLAIVLDNAAKATSNLNTTIVAAQPLVENFTGISGQLRAPGGLALWALGTNSNQQFATVLTNANALMVGVNTNLNQLTEQIGATLENLAGITSNLNVQVRANSNLLGGISQTVTDADDLMQGLKRHWLLRSAFKNKPANSPAKK